MLHHPPDKLGNQDFDFFFFAGSVVFIPVPDFLAGVSNDS